jgi:pseudo-rSAM protein
MKKNWIMLYNPITGKILEYRNKPVIMKAVRRLLSPGNHRVILLTDEMLRNTEISGFVNDLMSDFMGDMIETRLSKRKPIQSLPLLKIQNDLKYLKADPSRSVGENLLKYFTEVSIFLNGKCIQHCSFCNAAYKQFKCCTVRDERNSELNPIEIRDFLSRAGGSSLSHINILGGDIFLYTGLDVLLDTLRELRGIKSFYLHYLNVYNHRKQLEQLVFGSSRIKLLVDIPTREDKLNASLMEVDSHGVPKEVIFIIASEKQFTEAEDIVKRFSISDAVFQPFFNGANRQMFEQLHVDREELKRSGATLKDIYARQAINILDFGRLNILNDGRIFANLNRRNLGVLGKDSLHEVILTEMIQGNSWRKTRKNVMPCKQCVFQYLCPPLGNLNVVLKQNNLCSIFPG